MFAKEAIAARGAAAIDRISGHVRAARHLFVDWDGCLVRGDEPLPGAVAFMRRFGEKVVIVSNNSSDTPGDLSARLAREGVSFPSERILLAGDQALHYVRSTYGEGPIFLAAAERMHEHARTLGIRHDAERARAVVLLRDTSFSYETLTRAVNGLAAGLPLVVANTDRVHPGAGGTLIPETGALLAAIERCLDLSGKELVVIGKPGRALFELALQRTGAAPAEVVMLGDNPDTDVEGARRLGLGHVLVGGNGGLTLAALATL